jgi:hypothetical protein
MEVIFGSTFCRTELAFDTQYCWPDDILLLLLLLIGA